MWKRRIRSSGGHLAPALALSLAFGVHPASGANPGLLVRLPDPVASQLVHRGLQGAIARLGRSETCRGVLDDFATPSGQPLSSVLEAQGETPAGYLAGLLFIEGASHPHCRSGAVAAFTAPGWRVVYVCSAVFRRHLKSKPDEAEALLIHEALHTLGLGENPPTPREIQERVHARCVRDKGGSLASGRQAMRRPSHTTACSVRDRGGLLGVEAEVLEEHLGKLPVAAAAGEVASCVTEPLPRVGRAAQPRRHR